MQARDRQRKNREKVKVAFEGLIGILYFVAGILIIFSEKLGFNFNLGTTFLRLFGGLLILYGLFRIYRGVKQLFFEKE